MASDGHWQFWELFTCIWFVCGIGGWLIASLVKMFIAWMKTREFDFVYLFSTGGMPSSHSASVSALAFSVGFTEGFGSPVSTVAWGYAVITMFDAATVRRAAGEHARVLNAIVRDFKELRFKPAQRFKELLGHTRKEVLWGLATGIAWAAAVCCCWK